MCGLKGPMKLRYMWNRKKRVKDSLRSLKVENKVTLLNTKGQISSLLKWMGSEPNMK